MGRPKKQRNYKITVRYPHIYLVALGSSLQAEFRVTEREKGDVRKPGTLRFSGRRPDVRGAPIGTLVLDDAKMQEWFGGRKMMPNMKDAETAAKWMVANSDDIYFGCPICLFKTKSWEEYQAHIATKGDWVLGQFEIDVEEVGNGDTDERKLDSA